MMAVDPHVFSCIQPACWISVFRPALFLRRPGTEAKTEHSRAASPPPPPRESGGILLLRVSEGSVAQESCDHSGASASSFLLELRDLQGDVYQGGQHHLHRDNTNIQNIWLSMHVMLFSYILQYMYFHKGLYSLHELKCLTKGSFFYYTVTLRGIVWHVFTFFLKVKMRLSS